jgi:putative hydrolase of the HAD superfamily
MTVTHILFDLDNTLCDYRQARDNALTACFQLLADTHSAADVTRLKTVYHTLEPGLFRLFADGTISKRMYRLNRFAMPLQLLDDNRPHDDVMQQAQQMNTLYINHANTRIHLYDDVHDNLAYLRQHYHLCLLTNGPSDGQRQKIEALGIAGYFKQIFISEEIGAAKPDPAAYRHVLNALACAPENALMIGDSWQQDILPAREMGLSACYLNRQKTASSANSNKGFQSLTILVDDVLRI